MTGVHFHAKKQSFRPHFPPKVAFLVISISNVTQLQDDAVVRWHVTPISNECVDFDGLVLANHEINFRLWHEEDQARDPTATDAQIATVKRNIDRLNQMRSHAIERIDDAIVEQITKIGKPASTAPMNTETPGSAIDRLSILSLRIFHLVEECNRDGFNHATQLRVTQSLQTAKQQQANLATSLQQLIEELFTGKKRHQTFRQLKMYNDPELNPVIYKNERSES